MLPDRIRFPSLKSVAPNATSVTSVANDKGDNERIPGAVHRSPGVWKFPENLS